MGVDLVPAQSVHTYLSLEEVSLELEGRGDPHFYHTAGGSPGMPEDLRYGEPLGRVSD